MPKTSAGLLMFRIENSVLRVFLVHPGGPFWKNKNEGAWSIPKGEADNEEKTESELFQVAKREMKEETGINPPEKKEEYHYLGTITQSSGKIVHCWAFEDDWSGLLQCQSFVKIEFPYKSGRFITIPEVDKAEFFSVKEAKTKINLAQIALIEKLQEYLKEKSLI